MALTVKGAKKKKYILEKAAAVFIKKGYSAVTMKDIVEECGISRGGLYKYYSSTRDIFVDILSGGQEDDGYFFTEKIENGVNAVEILSDFLRQQKDCLLNIESTIRLAAYEFFLSHRGNGMENLLKRQYNNSVSVLSRVLNYGISRNEISKLPPDDIGKFADHIIILLEGLNILALSRQISPELIDEQFDTVIRNLI